MSIEKIIAWSVRNRLLVGLGTLVLSFLAIAAIQDSAIDAIPDLSDTQVIVYTEWPGQSPDLMEDQVTYPIVASLVSAPKVKVVRGSSFLGVSFVYVIFEDNTDLYWARSRVTEYLSSIQGQLPPGVNPSLGPDATGVGWAYQYVLTDESGKHSLADLRSFQDWYLRYWIASVPGVAEVASVGGFEKQYQVVVDEQKLRAYDIDIRAVMEATSMSNAEVGARVLEMAGREYMIRGRGYAQSTTDIASAVVRYLDGVPITVADVARVELGPDMRRGAVDWNGQGEAVGGIVVVRSGEDVRSVIKAVKAKIKDVRASLPEGVQLHTAYDRSELIDSSVQTLRSSLLEESLIVALICILFLWHIPSAFVAILSLPFAIGFSFIFLRWMGLSINIMSLGGIAIAIGDLIDSSIVMVENAHKRIEENPDGDRKEVLVKAAQEVGRPLFYSLLITTVSFLPVFTLEAQEGKLFSPLAYTKTFSMAWAAIVAITIVPILMTWLIRGRVRKEESNPISRGLIKLYEPVVRVALKRRKAILVVALLSIMISVPVYQRLGSEFMPPLNEGTILYMPTTIPGISITEAKRLLQVQDQILSSFPEVRSVFGKVGRAKTSTDPAPLSMIETTVVLHPENQWRAGLDYDSLINEMDAALKLPGTTNAWTMPIKGRIDMLTTGIRTPVGIKIMGPDLPTIAQIGQKLESALRNVSGTRSVFAERIEGGSFVDIDLRRPEIARYGLRVADVQKVVSSSIGGMPVGTIVKGPERYSLNVRSDRFMRSGLEGIAATLIRAPHGEHIRLDQIADISIAHGAPVIRNENGSKSGWVFVDVVDRDLGRYVDEAKQIAAEIAKEHPGYALVWSGQYEFMERATKKLMVAVPLTILAVFVLLYMNFGSLPKTGIVFLTIPFALIGSLGYLYLAGYNLSVAVWVGMIALAGVASETGVLMVEYLDQAYRKLRENNRGEQLSPQALFECVIEGAVQRVRPKIMTVASTILGLIPILLATGTGSSVMKRIAAPMVGGMVSSTVLTLIIIPVAYYAWRLHQISSKG